MYVEGCVGVCGVVMIDAMTSKQHLMFFATSAIIGYTALLLHEIRQARKNQTLSHIAWYSMSPLIKPLGFTLYLAATFAGRWNSTAARYARSYRWQACH